MNPLAFVTGCTFIAWGIYFGLCRVAAAIAMSPIMEEHRRMAEEDARVG